MMKLLGSLVIIVASLGIIYGGLRYIRFSKATFAKANVKVDFTKTPAAVGFAPGIIGALIMLVGFAGCVWGLMLF